MTQTSEVILFCLSEEHKHHGRSCVSLGYSQDYVAANIEGLTRRGHQFELGESVSKLKFAAVTAAAIGVGVVIKSQAEGLLDAAVEKLATANDKVDFLADLTRAEHLVRDKNPKVYEDLSGIIIQVSKATELSGMEICEAILRANELKELARNA